MKTIIYRGDINELQNNIKKSFDKSAKIIDKVNYLNIKSGENIIDIKIKDIGFYNTKFSNGKNPIKTYKIDIISNFESKLTEEIYKLCNIYSKEEIQNILDDMPLLSEFSKLHKESLNDIAIIFRDHFLEDNLALVEAFALSGVKKQDILVLDKGDKTLHQKEITNTLLQEGFNTFILDNDCCDNLVEIEKAYQKISTFCEERKHRKVIIFDDGAIITKVLGRKKIDNIIGIIELTEMGLRRIKNIEKNIFYPILNVAKTHLKISITYIEIANSIFFKTINLLGANKLTGRTIFILGYGDLGIQLAKKFKSHNMRVIIYDPDILKLINAAENGFTTYLSPITAIKEEKPFLMIGVSGYNSITEEMINLLPNNAFVTAGATADVSIFKLLEDKGIKYIEINKYGKQYIINNKTITLLGNGRSVNLFYSESIPNQANDIFKTSNYLASIYLSKNYLLLQNGLNNNMDKILNETELYLKYYKLYLEK